VREDRTWGMMRRASVFIIFSFFFHLVALLMMPNLLKPAKVTIIPVTLITTADLYLEPIRKSGIIKEEEREVQNDAPVRKIRDDIVLRKLSEISMREEIKPPLPKVSFFPSEKMNEQEKMKILKASSFYHELEEIMQKEDQQGELYDTSKPTGKDIKAVPPPMLEDVEAEQIIASIKEVEKEKERGKTILPETVKLGIKGPVASRRVLYAPPPPTVNVSVEADVLLKFWVLPDGTVGRVIPLVKGDAQVELAAINHIKRYKFNSLPHDMPQVEMWGLISVRTVLR
jgi:hypothetical protein